jgi:hypothetical protein
MNNVLAKGVNRARCRSSALAVAGKLACPVGTAITEVIASIDDNDVESDCATRAVCELNTA